MKPKDDKNNKETNKNDDEGEVKHRSV